MRPGSPLRLQPLPPSETTHAAPTTPWPRPTGVRRWRRDPRWPLGNQPASIPEPPAVALSALSWTAGTPDPSCPKLLPAATLLTGGKPAGKPAPRRAPVQPPDGGASRQASRPPAGPRSNRPRPLHVGFVTDRRARPQDARRSSQRPFRPRAPFAAPPPKMTHGASRRPGWQYAPARPACRPRQPGRLTVPIYGKTGPP